MTNENQEQQEGDKKEPAEAQPEAVQPTLNRAERRAQAKGKKGANASTFSSLHGQGNQQGGFQRGPGSVGKTRLPRTGHK